MKFPMSKKKNRTIANKGSEMVPFGLGRVKKTQGFALSFIRKLRHSF